MKNTCFLVAIMLLFAAFYSCSYTPYEDVKPEEPEVVSFSNDIEPIFSSCTGCHNSGSFDLTKGNAFASIVPSKVDLVNPSNSIIYTKPAPDGSHPVVYSQAQASLILKWIEDGAKNN